MRSLAGMLAAGAVPNLDKLLLSSNEIGDEVRVRVRVLGSTLTPALTWVRVAVRVGFGSTLTLALP